MRDPLVFVEDEKYYLLGTMDVNCWRGEASGFDAYVSKDLVHFHPAGGLFAPRSDFWGTENFWVPELHKYRGSYYLFAFFKAPGKRRGASILKAASPLGPYVTWGEERMTPSEWECLDGTLFVDGAGRPHVVFCHEWVQAGGGTICVRPLAEDLSGPAGQAVTLFSAAQAAWTKQVVDSSGAKGHVTDGPYLFFRAHGKLYMLWSSLSETGYAIGLSVSDTGGIIGPWCHQAAPLFSGDGGHDMLFFTLNGELRLAIHAPNQTPLERPLFLSVWETEGRLLVVPQEENGLGGNTASRLL